MNLSHANPLKDGNMRKAIDKRPRFISKDSWRKSQGEVIPSFESVRHLFNTGKDDTNWTPSSRAPNEGTEGTLTGSSNDNPVVVFEEDEPCITVDEPRRAVGSFVTSTTGSSTMTIPINEDGEASNENQDARRVSISTRLLRGPVGSPRRGHAIELADVEHNGQTIKKSSTVKLENGMWLRVEKIKRRQGQVFLWGRQLVGCKDSQWPNFIPKNRHELVWLPCMDHETDLESIETHLPVSLWEVRGLCQVIFTNERRPPNSRYLSTAGLFCRLKVTARKRPTISNHGSRGLAVCNYQFDTSVEYLAKDECDEGYGLETWVLRDLYRGCETIPFGEGPKRYTHHDAQNEGDQPVLDLTVEPTGYVFGDAYCGAGGASCGAQQAGVHIKWAIDMNESAVETYRMNFQDAIVHQSSFEWFLLNPEDELRCDLAHCSPPCQPFSPAHTVNCERDEPNSACIFSARNIIEKSHPRVITMEETAGLMERHKETLCRIIMDMVEMGYSTRWAIIDVLHYGVPQTRKRLILLAAGPGETLPPFPAITHDLPGSGCKAVLTIQDAISNIPDDTPNHDVQGLLRKWALEHYEPYDARIPAKTLTCSGGEANYHPSGKRKFTEREVACLQTFPLDFKFSQIGVRKQIGNAVPPALARVLYQEIIASLRATDMREQELRRDEAAE
ncbi:hypothetical protein N7539_004884 [Penicillium diatomitis]|uniref:DNA (cytosine-5-)-methyltransferase n=1 Tax=Penicillium diatomitis TaxID=2819901 RepID=A0A9W9X6C0_9EURO|nr:uncharacterized protein N7539_004884 [Penicillium diatomitis]KAJ5484896.1 hypothetical protein N7539_004884 [Penicillium diatomitis]